MEESSHYYVMNVDGQVVGPVAPAVISHMASKWQIGPDSPLRRGESGEWVTLRDVAESLGISLPDSVDWRTKRKEAIAKERLNLKLGCVVFLLIGWAVLAWAGLGLIVVPMLGVGVLFVLFCKLLSAMFGLDVLFVPMWTDIRVKRIPGQGLQMLAFALATAVVMAYYVFRFTSQ